MKSLKIKLLLSMLAGLLILSCQKEVSTSMNSTFKKNGGPVFSNWPMVNNGVLEFTDGQHITDYLGYLDSVLVDSLMIPPADTFLYDPDDKLAWVESNLPGFNSLRAHAWTEYEVLNDFGWEDLVEIPEMHFIQDISIRSLLNENMEVIVGSQKYKYITEDIGLAIEMGAPQELMDAFDVLPAGATLDEVYEGVLDQDIAGVARLFALHNGAAFGSAQKISKTTFEEYHIPQPNLSFPDACGNPKRIKLENIKVVESTSGPKDAQFTIDWGDYSTPTVLNSSYSGWGHVLSQVYHLYANNGTYKINIKARLNGQLGTSPTVVAELDIHNVQIGPKTCLYGQGKAIHSPHWKNSHGVAWAATCWVDQANSWLGRYHNRVGATTRIYKWKRGKWRARKGHPYAYFNLTQTDQNCNYQGNPNASHSNNKSRSTTVNYSLSGHFGWTDLHTDHQSHHNGQWNGNHQLHLKSCN